MVQFEKKPLGFLVPADILAAGVALLAAYAIRAHLLVRLPRFWTGQPHFWPGYGILFLGTIPLLLIALHANGAYEAGSLRTVGRSLAVIVRSVLLAGIGILAFAYVLRDHTFSRAIVFLYLFLAVPGFLVSRLLYIWLSRVWAQRPLSRERLLIVGTGPAARHMEETLWEKPYLGYEPVGFVGVPSDGESDPEIPTVGSVEELPELVDDLVIDAVLFATSLDITARYERIIWKLEEVGTTIHMRGDAVGVLLSRTFVGEFQGVPLLTLRSAPGEPLALAMKRLIDVAVSASFLLAGAPLLLAIALAVKLTSPGPVFFRQERVGLNGRRFRMLKFRSMYRDAEQRLQKLRDSNEVTGPVFKMKRDPRVTPVGRFLRKFSLDELPQLINVLRGEMSLVGPRPPLPEEVENYNRWQRRRLSMKPGLTCIWQVSGRSDVPFEEWMRMDLEYIDNWNLWLDLKLLFRTIPVVLLGKGAY